jgi:cell fate regulator YaaT (PSP1 superfamily)
MSDFEKDIDEDFFENEKDFESEIDGEGEFDSKNIITVNETMPFNTSVYQLKLSYSYETIYGAFSGDDIAGGSFVILPTRYGKDIARVTGKITGSNAYNLKMARIERVATTEDLEKGKYYKQKEKEAFAVCKTKIEEHNIDMKLVTVHYLFEESKILFFFTSENRVDFRELVKDLVSIFKTRIELRQIGIRDEARITGGLGICGRAFCCHEISDKLKPVSIKMAKDQNLSLNSMKISGHCGRLLCCLSYEHSFYFEERRSLPSEGAKVSWNGATWKVEEVNFVLGLIRISAEDGRQMQIPKKQFEKKDNHWIVNEA